MVSRQYGGISNTTGSAGRQEIWILPSKVTDRFGNWVTYSYDAANPWRVTSIDSSDDRHLTFTYQADGAYAVTDGTRTWTYSADGSTITLPDGSKWIYNLTNPPVFSAGGQPPHCSNGTWVDGNTWSYPITNTIQTPSGATVSFHLDWVRHGQTGLTTSCPATGDVFFGQTSMYDAFSIKKKVITGPGMPPGGCNGGSTGALWGFCAVPTAGLTKN